jgi:hypothetical protein
MLILGLLLISGCFAMEDDPISEQEMKTSPSTNPLDTAFLEFSIDYDGDNEEDVAEASSGVENEAKVPSVVENGVGVSPSVENKTDASSHVENEVETIYKAVKLAGELNLSSDPRSLMKRRAVFYRQVIFKEYKGPDCFDVCREDDQFKLTYSRKDKDSKFHGKLLDGYTLFHTPEELAYFLQILAISYQNTKERPSCIEAALGVLASLLE